MSCLRVLPQRLRRSWPGPDFLGRRVPRLKISGFILVAVYRIYNTHAMYERQEWKAVLTCHVKNGSCCVGQMFKEIYIAIASALLGKINRLHADRERT